MASENGKPVWVIIIEIFRWPLFAVVLVLFFWKPVYKSLEDLPNLVSNQETITVGGLSLRVGKSLAAAENQDVREALSGMSSEDVVTVLENDLPSDAFYSGDLDETMRQWQRLKRLGVVNEIPQEELQAKSKEDGKEGDDKYTYGIRPTGKYDKVRKFLVTVLQEVVSGAQHNESKVP
jgi:hypothetical protein